MRYILSLILLFSSYGYASGTGGSGNVSNVIGAGGFNGNAATGTSYLMAPSVTVPLNAQAVAGQAPLLKTLVAYQINATASTYTAFFDPSDGTNTQYHVPLGKKFYITSICWEINNGSTGRVIALGTATASFTSGQTAVPTGSVVWGNATGTAIAGAGFHVPQGAAGGVITGCWNNPTSFPGGAYPFFFYSAASQEAGMYIVGQEL